MGKRGRPKAGKLLRTPICKVCGDDISDGYRRGDIGSHGNYGTRYCSDECWDKFHKERLSKKCHICQHCGIAFNVNMLESSQKYCSVYCGHLAKGRKKEDRFCKECGKRLYYIRLAVEKGNFTGLCKPCYRRSIKVEKQVRVKKPDRFCDVCGKKLHHEQIRFCSRECAKSGLNERRKPKICEQCGVDFTTKKHGKRFCSRECCSVWTKENKSINVITKRVVNRKGIKRATRFAIFERDGFRCRYCGVRPGAGNDIRLELDHMVPICEGGTNDPGNLVTACNVCNSGKAHFKVKLRVVNPFKKKTIVEDDKPEQIGLFG